jgi:hypothetical protein
LNKILLSNTSKAVVAAFERRKAMYVNGFARSGGGSAAVAGYASTRGLPKLRGKGRDLQFTWR